MPLTRSSDGVFIDRDKYGKPGSRGEGREGSRVEKFYQEGGGTAMLKG
jgi:hypothetical protein